MPLLPYLISANALLCEKILHEQDKVLSAIRIIDVFYVTKPPEDAPKEVVSMIEPHCLAIFKTQPGHQEKHLVEFKVLNTKGELKSLGDPVVAEFMARSEFGNDVPGGANAAIQISIVVKNYGTYYICVYVDGEEVTRAPLTILPLPKTAEKTG